MRYKAKLFKGDTAKVEVVDLEISSTFISITADGVYETYTPVDCTCEAPLGNLPVMVKFPNNYLVEVENVSKVDLRILMKDSSSFLYKLESNIGLVFLSLILVVSLFFVTIKYGAPVLSKKVSTLIPQSVLLSADDFILNKLDDGHFSESTLSKERQDELLKYFNGYLEKDFRIHFRKGNSLGPNAFALAGNTLIFTDELVKKIDKKELLLPILFHEIGHLESRHLAASLTSVVSLNILSMLIIGDMTGMAESLTNVGFTLVSLKQSREYEIEADLFSAEKLKHHGISSRCFLDSFNELEEIAKSVSLSKSAEKTDSELDIIEIFSTHPNMGERVKLVMEKYPETGDCK
jgi:Zn-dependent protease with chaperone function